MPKYTVEQYNQIYSKLPEELKALSSSGETSDKVMRIGEKHFLQIDQIGILLDIVLDIAMGIVASKNFMSEIKNQLNIDNNVALSVVHDIDDEIFKPVRELMMRAYKDEAPNRPDSTLKTPHEEESHETISKKEIMAEIENPTKSEVKKISVNEVKGNGVEFKKAETKEVEEYHTELNGKSLPRSDLPDGKSTTGVIMPSQAKSVSSIKLENATSPNKIEPVKKYIPSEDTNNKKIDPYREPIV